MTNPPFSGDHLGGDSSHTSPLDRLPFRSPCSPVRASEGVVRARVASRAGRLLRRAAAQVQIRRRARRKDEERGEDTVQTLGQGRSVSPRGRVSHRARGRGTGTGTGTGTGMETASSEMRDATSPGMIVRRSWRRSTRCGTCTAGKGRNASVVAALRQKRFGGSDGDDAGAALVASTGELAPPQTKARGAVARGAGGYV